MANSKIESVEAKSSKLMKDLIEALDIANKAKEKVKELSEELRVEKMLIVQKDEEIQAALLQIDSKREKIIQKIMKSEHFSDLQFIQYYKGFEHLCRWTMKHHNQAVDFPNLDFETIDMEVLVDKAKEQEEAAAITVGGEDAPDAGRADQSQGDEAIAPPPQKN